MRDYTKIKARELADAISKNFQWSELRQRLGSNARKQAERNRPAHVAEVSVAADRRILEESGGRRV